MTYAISLNLTETQAMKQTVKSKSASFFALDNFRLLGRFSLFVCVLLATLILGFAISDDAYAATKKKSKAAKSTENKLYSAIVVDAQTGEVLMARQADSIRHPASLTKMMTLYMLFEAMDQGRVRMNDRVPMSTRASHMSPSKLGIPAGGSLTVENAIKALVTKSANDVACATAEKLGGSEKAFAAKMTRKAKELGMSRTVFRNASGLPDPQQVTSARDMAKLAMALLRDFPAYYHYFGVRNFEYGGVSHHNHNRLLGEYPGLDGIKTGYINASGFNLVASAKQNNRRLVGVVFGGKSWRSRNDHMVKLLDEGFVELRKRKTPIQEASAPAIDIQTANAVPIPLPPPMMDDVRGVESTITTRADETDSAEETTVYTSEDSQRINAMIGQIQTDDVDQGSRVASAAPLPPMRPSLEVDAVSLPIPEPVAPAVKTPAKVISLPPSTGSTTPAGAARTVMQLRIPASQLPKGINPSQIVRANSPQGWAIQVGAYQSRAMTDQALRTAQARLPANLQQGHPVIVPQNTGGGLIFRARLQGFDELQANSACAHLGACLVVAPGS